MKTKLVAIISVLSIVGIFSLAVVQLNQSRSLIAMAAFISLLIPMYFLFAALVMGKYKRSDKKTKEKLKKKTEKQRNWKEGDFGKVLEFPSGKSKKDE